MSHRISSDRLRKIRLKKMIKKLKETKNPLWPELECEDLYFDRYYISKEEYLGSSPRVYSIKPVERLFEYMAMMGSTREEAARVLLFMDVIINADKLYLDVKKAREELRIEELVNKYMKD